MQCAGVCVSCMMDYGKDNTEEIIKDNHNSVIPIVSIIVPAYNAQKTIIRCIESLANQSCRYIEIIVVDDGSEDDTAKIVKKAVDHDDRIRLIEQVNGGPGKARNTGIDNARGEYIAFVDADDMVDPEYVSFMLSVARDKNVEMVTTLYYRDRKEKKKSKNRIDCFRTKEKVADQAIKLLKQGRFNSSHSKLYRSDVIKANGIFFPESLIIGEDFCFNIEYVEHIGSMACTDRRLYHYIEDDTGITRQVRLEEYERRVKSIERLSRFMDDNRLSEKHLIDFLYIKLVYADVINTVSAVDFQSAKNRAGQLLEREEIKSTVGGFKPSGIVETMLFVGIREKSPLYIVLLSMAIGKTRGIINRISVARASI